MELEYAQSLQNFFCDALLLFKTYPSIILRDSNLLPEKSGFDVDVLIDSKNFQNILFDMERSAAKHNLILIKNNLRIALFYPSFEQGFRNWAILDFQTSYKFGNQILSFDSMFKMPKKKRDKLIKNVQDARKGRGAKNFAREFNIQPYSSGQMHPPNFMQRLKRKLLNNLYFFHFHTMPFIVISGPDGVGKSTLINNILLLFSSLPFQIESFHHTELTKRKIEVAQEIKHNLTMFRKFLRRFTPSRLKIIYGTITGETRYATVINKKFVEAFYNPALVISDRYIYDRTIKMKMLPKKSMVSKFIVQINSKLMRRPSIVIIPRDSEKNIFSRKQELNPSEITYYYSELDKILHDCKAPIVHNIDMKNREPKKLALATAKIILASLNSDFLFKLIGTYEKDLKKDVTN